MHVGQQHVAHAVHHDRGENKRTGTETVHDVAGHGTLEGSLRARQRKNQRCRRAAQSQRSGPFLESIGQPRHIEHAFGVAAAAKSGLVGNVDVNVARQFARERHHIAM